MPIIKTSEDLLNRRATYKITEDVAFVNSLRRIIIAEIPNVAFDPKDMQVLKNTGNLHNEFLTHRISMIPIMATADIFDRVCQATFTLHKKNDTNDVIVVSSGDFEYTSIDQTLFPANHITKSHIMITKLLPGQEIHVVCKASIGISKVNARWCPISKCSYMNSLDNDEVEKHRAISPVEPSIFEAHHKYRYFKKNEFGDACEFDFFIDSECALTPDYLIKTGIDILVDKLNNSLDKSKAMFVDGFGEIRIPDEDYTLVNLMQGFIYNQEIRGRANEGPLTFIGYYKTHPLDNIMVLKLKFKEGHEPESFIKYLKEQNELIIEKIKNLYSK